MISSKVVLTEARLLEVRDALLQDDAFVWDVETVGDRRGVPKFNPVTWMSIVSEHVGVVIPCGHLIGTKIIGHHKEPSVFKTGREYNRTVTDYEDPPPQMTPETVFGILEPVFMSETITKVAQEITFDLPTVAKYYGEIPCGPYDDPKVVRWLLDENERQYGLKERVKQTYGVTYDKENTGRCVEIHPFGMVAHYCYMDSLYAWLLWQRDLPDIAAEGLTKVHAIEKELMGVLSSMRLAGTPVDVPRITTMRTELRERLVIEKAAVYKAAKGEFNLNSPAQKQVILYGLKPEGQGLKPWKLTDGGKAKQKRGLDPDVTWYSTDSDALESYPTNPVAKTLLTYSNTHKLLTGFVEAWLGNEEEGKESKIYDGSLYTHFKQYGTVSGRLSSAAPNVQNIPRADTPDGKLVRGAVVAPEGWLLAVADWGQIELVILAHFIGKGKLYQGFLKGIDPHVMQAAGALGKVPENVTPKERQDFGKTLGFAISYGAGIGKIASMMGVSERRARVVLAKHETEFPEIYAYKDHVIELAARRKPPHIVTLLGRKRRVSMLNSHNKGQRRAAERQLFNSLIQGSAADLMKLALIYADDMLARELPDAYLTMTVHDEIVALAPAQQADDALAIITEAMTGPHIQKLLRVPLSVSGAVCARWSDAKG